MKRGFKFILSLALIVMLGGISFCFMGCEEKPNPLSAEGTITVTVGAKKEDVLSGVKLTYTDPDGDTTKNFTATGLEEMQAKNVVVFWTGSYESLKGKTCKVTFSYAGYTTSLEYTVT